MGTQLTPDNVPASRPASIPPGHDVRSLGPSDSSDSGSDLAGRDIGEDETESEIAGGEQTAEPSDVAPDRVVDADEAGLGRGLDQAEEARLGIKDEDLEDDRD